MPAIALAGDLSGANVRDKIESATFVDAEKNVHSCCIVAIALHSRGQFRSPTAAG
jgi:hypothetical protein